MTVIKKSKLISLSGILIALCVVFLFFANTMPTGRLSLYAASSFLVSVIIIEFSIKAGWLFYLASTILAFIILPDKLGIIPYLSFFGLYGIIKYYIEKLNKLYLELFLKFVYFNSSLFSLFIFIKEFIFVNVKIKFPYWVIIIIMELIFFIYDYVYTLFIQYYENKLRKILKI